MVKYKNLSYFENVMFDTDKRILGLYCFDEKKAKEIYNYISDQSISLLDMTDFQKEAMKEKILKKFPNQKNEVKNYDRDFRIDTNF